MKTIFAATGALLLSSAMAFAQMPAGPGTAPNGADGAQPTPTVGSSGGTARNSGTGQTQSSSMLSQQMKMQSQAGGQTTGYNQSSNGPMGNQTNGQMDSQPARYGQTANANMNGGASMGGGKMYHGRNVAITDEYGNKYDEQGQRIR